MRIDTMWKKTGYRTLLVFIAIGMALLGSYYLTSPASAASLTLNSGSASTQVSTDGGTTFAAAVIVTTNIPPPWAAPISGTQYINCDPSTTALCGLK
jgi:hypothetical protein